MYPYFSSNCAIIEYNYDKMKSHVKELKRELIEKYAHPTRLQRYLDPNDF